MLYVLSTDDLGTCQSFQQNFLFYGICALQELNHKLYSAVNLKAFVATTIEQSL